MKDLKFILLAFFIAFLSCQSHESIEKNEISVIIVDDSVVDNETYMYEDAAIDDDLNIDDDVIDDLNIDDDIENKYCNAALGWVVRLTLIPQEDESYKLIEDPEIIALILKHNVKIEQMFPHIPDMLFEYALFGRCCDYQLSIPNS